MSNDLVRCLSNKMKAGDVLLREAVRLLDSLDSPRLSAESLSRRIEEYLSKPSADFLPEIIRSFSPGDKVALFHYPENEFTVVFSSEQNGMTQITRTLPNGGAPILVWTETNNLRLSAGMQGTLI